MLVQKKRCYFSSCESKVCQDEKKEKRELAVGSIYLITGGI